MLCAQLLDVGTCPQPGSMSKLIVALEENHQIGGVCGEIAARQPKFFNFIESAQHFEYKISHVLDKGVCGGLNDAVACPSQQLFVFTSGHTDFA